MLTRFPGAFNASAYAGEDLGTQMSIATWPNYHDPATFENFKAATGVAVSVNVFGSNEEMLAKIQAGASGWSLFVPTNYTISTYQKLGLIEELDLAKIPEFQPGNGKSALYRSGQDRWQDLLPCRRTGARPVSR